MRIGIDARPLSKRRTGIGVYVYSILSEIQKLDKENDYFLYSNKPIELPFDRQERWHERIFDHNIGTLWYMKDLPSKLKQDGIDVFWGTQHVLPPGNKNIRYILTIHDLAVYKFPQVGTWDLIIMSKFLTPYSAKKAHKIITVSKSSKRDILDLLKVNDNLVDVIYFAVENIAIDIDIAAARKKLCEKFGINKHFILYIGTLEPRKNIANLIRAYHRSVTEGNIDELLVLAGGKGWKYNDIFALVDELKLKDKVIFTGYFHDDDKIDLLKTASLFVFPSLYEGFGAPVLEALKSGVPVITSNISSLPEVAGNAAILVDPYDCSQLSEAIVSVLSNPSLQAELKQKGIEQAKKFNLSDCALKTYKVLTG